MEIIWTSRRIHIRGELYLEVRVAADGQMTLGTYNNDVQASELSVPLETFGEISEVIDEGMSQSLAARGAK